MNFFSQPINSLLRFDIKQKSRESEENIINLLDALSAAGEDIVTLQTAPPSDVDGNIVTLQIRRDTTANWELLNPILAPGEEGFEIDVNRIKVGDGITNWVGLDYVDNEEEFAIAMSVAL